MAGAAGSAVALALPRPAAVLGAPGFLDARSLPEGTRLEADVAIVGAGAAGITLALGLRDSGLGVVLLESGGLEFEAETQALYEGDSVGWPYPGTDVMRLRWFGGTTNHWEGNCRPLDAIDFEEREGIPHGGWPFAQDELVPYYVRAEATCETGPFDYGARTWSGDPDGPPLPLASDRLVTGLYRRSPPTRFGERYRDALAAAGNVTVVLHANAMEIDTDDGAREVREIRLATLAGTRITATARAYVLAAGAIETARLMLLSDRARPEGLGNDRGLVGRFFAEHVVMTSGILVLSEAEPPRASYDVERPAYGVLLLAEDLMRREGLVGLGTVLEYATAPVGEGAAAAYDALEALGEGDISGELATDAWTAVANLDDVAAEAWRRMVGAPRPAAYRLHARVEPLPDPDSRVTLGDDVDRLGQRKVRLDWRHSLAVLRSVRRFHDLLAEEAGRLGLGRLRSHLGDDPEAWPARWAPSGHHLGTLRMSDDPATGVVDRDGLVHGLANLYVAGGAVFPTYGCSNPTLTIVALAHRLADHLRSALGR